RKPVNMQYLASSVPGTQPPPCGQVTTSSSIPIEERYTDYPAETQELEDEVGSRGGVPPAAACACAPPTGALFPRDSLTRSRSSLPTLKKGRRLGCTCTGCPVRGLRPSYDLYSRTVKLPNPRISMPSPRLRASTIESKIQ